MNDTPGAGASTRCTGLRRITGLDPDRLAQIWGREPRHVPAAALPTPFADLLGPGDVDDLLSRRGLRAPFLRVARDGRTLPDAEFTRGGGVGAAITDQLDDTALLRLFAEGHSLVLQGLHRTHPPLLDFSQQLAADLGHPVQVNAYITPAQSTGFSAHYDVHDVFVLQVAGEKRWRLYPPVVTHPLRDQPWQEHAEAVEQAASAPPRLEVTLRPGDTLYVPRGWLHAATALGGVSTHVTVGVHVWHRGHLAETLLDRARREVLGRADQRTPLRPGVDVGDADAIGDEVEQVRAALLDALADVDAQQVAHGLAARHRAGQRPAPVPPVATVAAADGVVGPRLRPRLHLAARIERGDDGYLLVSRTGRLPLREGEAVTVGRWLDGEPVDLDDGLARRLLLAGVGTLPGLREEG
ncbi:cupin domain-containing protein [Janibacter alittae]|uniref:Cupin domain-containing protein n=1 Tax=Janibacter alittae TaxID=3115209 RepID=A0ABZ2MGI2_9MICO